MGRKEQRMRIDPLPNTNRKLVMIILVLTGALIGAMIYATKAMADPVATSTLPAQPSGEGAMSSLMLWLQTIALPAITVPLILALVKAAQWFGAKTNNAMVAGVLERLAFSVGNAVKAVQQEYVNALTIAQKPDSDGGSIVTADEAATAKALAIAKAKSYWGAAGLDELAKVVGLKKGYTTAQINDVIGNQVEAAVHDLKLTREAVKRGTGDLPLNLGATQSIPPSPR